MARSNLPWIVCGLAGACAVPRQEVDVTVLPEQLAEEQAFSELPSPPPPVPSRCQAGVMAYAGAVDYPTAVEAVAVAPAGSTVFLCPGIHSGALYRSGDWPLAIVGVTGDPADVVVEGTATESTFSFSGDPIKVRMRGITGSAAQGVTTPRAMLVVWYDGLLDVDRCIFIGAGDPVMPLAAIGEVDYARFTRTIFRNAANSALYINHSGLLFGPSTVILRETLFEDNVGYYGAAVQVYEIGRLNNLTLRVEDSIFRDNRAKAKGGAINIWANRVILDVRRTTFERNLVYPDPGEDIGQGATVQLEVPGQQVGGTWMGHLRARFEDCSFTDNVVSGYSSALQTQGSNHVYRHDAIVDVVRTEFLRNELVQAAVGWPYPSAVSGTEGTVMNFQDCDFGLGVDENLPYDIGDYPYQGMHLGYGVTMQFVP